MVFLSTQTFTYILQSAVKKDWRSKKVGLPLYQHLLRKLKAGRYQQVLLDTPAVAKASHRFYERAEFKRIEK